MRHLKMSYSDVLLMPVYERRFYLTSFINENEKKREIIEEKQVNSGNGKGTRTTKVSGSELKSRIKSGENF